MPLGVLLVMKTLEDEWYCFWKDFYILHVCDLSFHIESTNSIIMHIHTCWAPSISDMDIFLADASQQLGDKLEKLLVFNEVHDVRTKQEKRIGIAEGNIRKYAESFCSEEQHTPQEPESQLGLQFTSRIQ